MGEQVSCINIILLLSLSLYQELLDGDIETFDFITVQLYEGTFIYF